MTEKTGQTPANDTARPMRRIAISACFLVLALLALAAAWYACPWFLRMRDNTAPPDLVQTQQRLAEVERQIHTLDDRLNDLSARAGKNTESEASSSAPSPAVTHMQSDLAALASAVGGFQAALKQADNATAHAQQATQSSLAAAIAFIQLRETAEAGRGFASELSALRTAVKGDSGFQEAIGKLEPYAAKGAPTLENLRNEFIALESSALVGMDKSAAQNWWQRLLAELKGLVSIRPLHGGGESDAFTAAEDALASGNLDAALTAANNLPAGAQETLKDWRVKAEARETIETALHALSDRFIASVPNAQDEP